VPAALPYWRLSSFYFFYFALLGAWLPFWPLYLKDRGFSAAAIGLLAGIMQGTKIIAPHLWGWLADRGGSRMHVVRSGAIAATLIFSIIFLRNDFFALALIIAGYSFFWNAVLSQFEVATLAHLRDAFQRYSLVRVWGSIGFITAVAGLGFLFETIPLTGLPAILVALLAGIAISSLLVNEPQRATTATPIAPGSLRAIASAGGMGISRQLFFTAGRARPVLHIF
jgi:PPP family 3-phenylpropionic acid transporter